MHHEIINYIEDNGEEFKSILLSEAQNVASKINSILEEGNIDLLKNAEKIASYVFSGEEEELVAFAKVEGIIWARHALTLDLKLEWIHALRRTLWDLSRSNHSLAQKSDAAIQFFELEKQINDGVDKFLNNFFISYSEYKDELIVQQRQLVEHLSIPIIPLSSTYAVLPLIGTFDSYRMNMIEEKIMNEITRLEIDTLIIDLSGIPDIDEYNLAGLERVLNGVAMMGSRSILTGLRPQLAKKMAGYGTYAERHFKIKGSLQQAIKKLQLV